VIKAHSLLLPSGSAAKKELKGVGDKIANILNALGVQGDGTPNGSTAVAAEEPAPVPDPGKVVKKRKTAVKKPYQPTAKSGGYGILLALYRHSDLTEYMTKPDIIKHGEQYCSSSFTMPSTSSQNAYSYTAWSSMTKLLTEELVLETGNPKRYALTEDGKQLAKKLSSVHDKGHIVHSSGSDSDLASVVSSQPDLPPESPIASSSGLNMGFSENAFNGYGIPVPNPRPNHLSLNSFRSRSWQPDLEKLFHHPTRTVPFQARPIPSKVNSAQPQPENNFVNKFHQQRLQKEKDETKKVLESFSGKTRIMKSG
jgi:hypothetical protein